MKIKTIDVDAKEWFDKVNGNSYFAGIVHVNYGMKTEKRFIMPFQYGYGSQYKQEAITLLKREGLTSIPDKDYVPLWRYCSEKNIILRTNLQEKCLKRELTNIS